MCGRFTLTADAEQLQQTFQLASRPPELAPRYNIAPTQSVAVVLNRAGQRQLDAFRWGLIPPWAKDKAIGNRMINARGETAAEKASFKGPFRRQRCLVLADGFYEWQKTADGKQPTYIHLPDRQPFALAGLWERWQDRANDAVIHSCTILTTAPNELVALIHNRMPVILPPPAIDLWLDPTVQSPAELQPLLVPYPAGAMSAYPVSRLVNSPANEGPGCVVGIN